MTGQTKKPCRSGAIRPDPETIKRLREERGWNQDDFARKVGCGKRTVEKLEAGSCCFLFTLGNVAAALKVELKELISGGPPLPPAPVPQEKRRFEVEIRLGIPYEEFDETSQLVGFVDFLRNLFSRHIDAVKVRDGSTVVTLAMTEEDIIKLGVLFGSLPRINLAGGQSLSFGSALNQNVIRHGDGIVVNGTLEVSNDTFNLYMIAEIKLPDDAEFSPDELRGKTLR